MISTPVHTSRASTAFAHFLLFWVLLLVLAPALGNERLSASLDRDRVAVNETFELAVEWRGGARGQPDFSALEHDFEILGMRQSSQTNMEGVNVSTVTRWHLTLLPQEAGTLIIPSFHFEGAVSDALPIEVSAAAPSGRAGQSFWLESSIDRKQAHVGEQILVIYRLHYASPLRQMSRSDLTVDGAEVLPLQERQFQTVIDGAHFQVVELRFALFASRDGTLEIPPLQLDGYSSENTHPRLGGLIRGLGDPIRLRSETHQVEILPRPAAAGSSVWLPARGVSLSEQWSHQDQALRVGEPVTRTVRLDAQGVKAQQLPELNFGDQEGFRIYPEQPRLGHREDENGLLASRIESHALIASRPGLLTLPPVRVQWWDTETDRMRETVLEGRTLEVLPAADAVAPAQPDTGPAALINTAAEPQPRHFSIVLALSLTANAALILILAYGIWRTRQRDVQPQTYPSAGRPERRHLERRLHQLAKTDDGRAFRTALLEWARVQWAGQTAATLNDLASLADRPRLTQRLRELDEALYDHGTRPSAELKADILAELKAIPARQTAKGAQNPLPPLYP